MKKKPSISKTVSNISIIAVSIALFITLLSTFVYRGLINDSLKTEPTKTQYYRYHLALVSSEFDDPFWQSVYAAAKEEGVKLDACVEWVGNGLSSDFTLAELMEVAINSSVDGIIVSPDGSPEMEALINEAVSLDIPVITLMADLLDSDRQGFVGINSYDLGTIYGEELIKSVEEKYEASLNDGSVTGRTRAVILFDEDNNTNDQNIIFSSIFEAIEQFSADFDEEQAIVLDVIKIDSKNTFSSEEVIRELIMNRVYAPDVIICLDATNTICAYQSIVDYNMVGEITILGYYDSDEILDAIKKNIIRSTVAVHSDEVGVAGVDALMECIQYNRTSDYTVVGLNLITKQTVFDYSSIKTAKETK